MTGRNKWIGVVLCLAVAAQFCNGVFSVVWIALGPRQSLSHLIVRVRTHRFIVQPFPEVNLDSFELCVYKLWNLEELIYYNLTIFFGKSHPPGTLTYLTSHFPASRHYRSSCLLNCSGHSQEIKAEQIPGHA